VTTTIEHPGVDERRARGKAARERTNTSSHTKWKPADDRPEPVALLVEQDAARVPELVPVRHGRMMVSPFTFYRGAAKIMASDLSGTPTAGLNVQLCGDAHLSNFGGYASPERTLMFDLNDFDETLPGPFEYDVKRMAASFTIAARNNAFNAADANTAAVQSVAAYRTAMAGFAEMRVMDIWYAHMSESDVLGSVSQYLRGTKGAQKRALAKRADTLVDKAHTRDSLQALSKLAEYVDGQYRIKSDPPLVVPARDFESTFKVPAIDIERTLHDQFRSYRATLQDDRRHLLEQFQVIDVAHKVVGVGSVGMRAFIILLQGRDQEDPLFLQVKEATSSVLEDHLPKSRYRHMGERVVYGQRMMQAASDIYLGWTDGLEGRHLYWRQLRDMKVSATVDTMDSTGLEFYAQLCGHTLARAHARSGDPVAIAAYLGKKDKFEKSIADFAQRYADQNERDYEAFVDAIKTGRLEAEPGL
jgi:uncharacterized protein (DUF2252 family)